MILMYLSLLTLTLQYTHKTPVAQVIYNNNKDIY